PPSIFVFFFHDPGPTLHLSSFPTRRSSDLSPFHLLLSRAAPHESSKLPRFLNFVEAASCRFIRLATCHPHSRPDAAGCRIYDVRSEEHTSELQSRENLVCRLLLEKKKKDNR